MTLTASFPWLPGGLLNLRKGRGIATGIGFPPFAVLAVLLQLQGLALAQQPPADWQQLLREQVKTQQLDAALATVERRLADNPADLEAHGWRGRVLAWKGYWGKPRLNTGWCSRRRPTTPTS